MEERLETAGRGVISPIDESRAVAALSLSAVADVTSSREYLTHHFTLARDILTKTYIILNHDERPTPLKEFLSTIEAAVIRSTLGVTGGSQKKAAQILGVKETALCEKIKRLKIKSTNRNSG